MSNNNVSNKSQFFFANSDKTNKSNFHPIEKTKNQSIIPNYKNKLNINDFITQKNKFRINNHFDEKGSKNFLLSKENAMMEMKFNDEILDNNEENSKILIKNISNKKLKNRIRKEKTISPKMKKIKTKKYSINLFAEKNNEQSSNDSNNRDHIYKFIIDNANESEDKFYKKLQKEMDRLETEKRLSHQINNDKIIKSLTNQKIEKKVRPYSIITDKRKNPFDFSETAKQLMITEEIEVSSINNDDTTIPDRHQIKTVESVYANKKDNDKINLFEEKTNKNDKVIDKVNNMSDKESLLSIISDLF